MMKMNVWKPFLTVVLTISSLLCFGQGQQDVKQVVKRIEYVLCPDQKPVGQPATSATPEIRVVKVKDFSDAQAYLLRMCPQKEIKEEKKAGNFYYTYAFPDGKGELVLTDKVKAGSGEVAILEVNVPSLNGKVKQVKFIK